MALETIVLDMRVWCCNYDGLIKCAKHLMRLQGVEKPPAAWVTIRTYFLHLLS